MERPDGEVRDAEDQRVVAERFRHRERGDQHRAHRREQNDAHLPLDGSLWGRAGLGSRGRGHRAIIPTESHGLGAHLVSGVNATNPEDRMEDTTQVHYTRTQSPVGELLLVGDQRGLHAPRLQEGRRPGRIRPEWVESDEPFAEVLAQLGEYFEARRREFDLPVAPSGTPFQLRLWSALRKIPYGRTA